MRAPEFDDKRPINRARTLAIATALTVHIGAMLFLLAPARPAAQTQLEDTRAVNVVFVEPPLPPPPEPPVPPEPPRTPPVPRPTLPPQVQETPSTPGATTDAVDMDIVTNVPDTDPVTPPDPPGESFSDARADARYGDANRVRYPPIALRKREQGEVQLRVLIGRSGTALKVELARSSGSRELDRAALKAVLTWRFVAAEHNGASVEAWVIVPINFNLDQA